MKVNNPTDKEVSIVYKGTRYSVEPNGERGGITEEVAESWKRTHAFLKFFHDSDATANVEPQEEQEENEEELDLDSMKRADLDALAPGVGINPEEYSKVDELREAIAQELDKIN